MKAMIVAVMLLPGMALAQVPGSMSFQGRLLRTDGSPETGSPEITFRIYTAGVGGDELWSEPQTVKLTNGFYAVQLGGVKPFPSDLFNGRTLWLGVQVTGDSEMVPRQYIATVPYAFKAATADSAASASSAASANHASTADSATSAGAVAWTGVTGKPSAYPSAAHTHAGTDVTSAVEHATNAGAVPWTGITGRPSTFAPAAHTHTDIAGTIVGGYSVTTCGQAYCCTAWGAGSCAAPNSSQATCTVGTYHSGFCIR